MAKNGRIDYITTNLENPTREQIEKIVKARWSIEGNWTDFSRQIFH
ncbi:hypothetical protein [Candidatus Tisiphia endosymbiont of Parasteatoda lunata]